MTPWPHLSLRESDEESLQGREMRGIVPAQQGPIGKELVRVEDLLLGLDEPEIQLIGGLRSRQRILYNARSATSSAMRTCQEATIADAVRIALIRSMSSSGRTFQHFLESPLPASNITVAPSTPSTLPPPP